MTVLKRNILEFSTEIILPYALIIWLSLSYRFSFQYASYGGRYLLLFICFAFAGLSARSLFRYNTLHLKHRLEGWQLLYFVYFSLLLGVIIASWVMAVGMFLSWLGD